MGDTNAVDVKYVEESVLGTTPVTPAFKALRYTGAPSLAFAPSTVSSNEIESSRNVADLSLVGAEAAGQIDHELSFLSLDDIIEAALFSTWQDKANRATVAGITGVVNATTQYDISSGGGDLAFAEGMLCEALGFVEAANNGVFRAETGSGASSVERAGVADETPGATAILRQVGFQGASGDLVAVADGVTSTLLDFTTMGLSVGEWVKWGGTAAGDKWAIDVDNNDWSRISVIAAGKLTLTNLPTGWGADAGTGQTVMAFVGSHLTNGILKRSFTLEQTYTDMSPVVYSYLNGMVVSSLAFNMSAQSIVTMQSNFLGTNGLFDTTRFAGSTDIAAPTNDVLNTSSNVGQIGENGVVVTGPNFVLESNITIDNNLRTKNAIGSVGAVGIGAGECTVTGTLNTFFGTKDLVEKVINNTESSYDIRFTNSNNNNETLLLDMPRTKYSEGAPTTPGKNDDVTVDLSFQAIKHSTLGYTIRIGRFYYVE